MEIQHQRSRKVQVQTVEIQVKKRTFEELYHYILDNVWFGRFSRDDLVGYLVSLKVTHDEEIREAKNESN